MTILRERSFLFGLVAMALGAIYGSIDWGPFYLEILAATVMSCATVSFYLWLFPRKKADNLDLTQYEWSDKND